ncbi:hypothetical protein AFV6_gp41 [Betalipothrixvirus pozzuoliense]|uniref:Uncharacterized protein n=1 Tax=Betalipothrixvirus pozzuoliense TaxID=346882 RepID=A7WKJ5_9VIRU|nr:hypothetical protein AFV6_gp41 [Acidianus filamentous virus 6]CAJ31595.1 conserved hypothetical protein [Acidianus filamentous virus 6]
MINLANVAITVACTILSFLERISRFIAENVNLFLLIVPIGDVFSFITSTPILSRLVSLLQIF